MEPDLKSDSAMCLAVARAIAAMRGLGTVTSFDDPDNSLKTAGAPQRRKFIDLVVTTEQNVDLALEHTVIEPHEGRLEDGRRLVEYLVPLETAMMGLLPTDRTYHLTVQKGAISKELDISEVQRSVGDWIAATAPELPAGGPSVAPSHVANAGPPLLPIGVALYAWPASTPPGPGRLSVGQSAAESEAERATARADRYRRAFNDKIPKLLERPEALKILVLEDRDLATSNPFVALEAARRAADGRSLPDVVALVDSSIGEPILTILFEDGSWVEDLEFFPLV